MRIYQAVILAFLIGLALGHISVPYLSAQPAMIIRATDSTSGTSVVIQTDGNNALKVAGQ